MSIFRNFLCALGIHSWHENKMGAWNKAVGGWLFVKCRHCPMFKQVAISRGVKELQWHNCHQPKTVHYCYGTENNSYGAVLQEFDAKIITGHVFHGSTSHVETFSDIRRAMDWVEAKVDELYS